MSNWIYIGTEHPSKEITNIDDLPTGVIGFAYKITHLQTGKYYVGKKSIYHNRKKKLTKKEKLLTENKRKRVKNLKIVVDWVNYYGSSKELLSDIELYGKDAFKREILEYCYCSTSLTYSEVKWMFHYNVLEVDTYNKSILGRFYRGKIKCG